MAYGGPPTRIQYRRESVSLEPIQAFHRSVDGLHSTLRRYTLLRSALPKEVSGCKSWTRLLHATRGGRKTFLRHLYKDSDDAGALPSVDARSLNARHMPILPNLCSTPHGTPLPHLQG